ncbi:MAG: sugar phosphate isomerase/epimerase family protein [Planctomycetota bacterium]
MKFGMCNEFCEGWDFGSVCDLARGAGYDGVEVAPFTLADSVREIDADKRRELVQTARERGLEIIGLHWLLVKPEGLHLNSPDPEVRARTVDYLRAEIEFCADIGGDRMIVGSPKQRNVPEEQSYDQVWNRSVAAFRGLAEHAADRGVCLCIEPLGASETDFVTTAAEARRLVDAVDRGAFQLMLDVKAMAEDEKPAPRIIRESAGYLRHFHANDENRLWPGSGDTDFRPIVDALRDIGYDDYISVEVFDFSAGPETIARESMKYLREVFR